MRNYEYLLLQYYAPGAAAQNVGVFVWDGVILLWRISEALPGIEDPFAIEILTGFNDELVSRLGMTTWDGLLSWMEDTLSNALRVSEREVVTAVSPEAALDQLFRQFVVA